MTYAGEGHCEAAFIGGGNYFIIANRTARLDHAGRASIRRRDEPVREREKGVAADSASFQGEARLVSLPDGDARGIHSRHLTCTDAQGAISTRIHDGV
jgi:hypothetical protein